MLDYRACITTVINQGGYALVDIEDRINKLWIEGKLTDDDRDELIPMAAEHAQDRYQVDVVAKLEDLERRVYELEHPAEEYVIWTPGYVTQQHETVRFDVTGDGEYDLCRYDGGRAYTSLGICKIEGWHLVDENGNPTHDITRDAAGGYVLTAIATDDEG